MALTLISHYSGSTESLQLPYYCRTIIIPILKWGHQAKYPVTGHTVAAPGFERG